MDVDTPALPEETGVALKSAYEEYAQAISERSGADVRNRKAAVLANMALLGRSAGWPYRMLAQHCGITPERLRQIANASATSEKVKGAPDFPPYSPPPKVPPRPQRQSKHLTEDEARHLRELAGDARQNTGSRPKDSRFRKSSEEFSRLIMEHHDQGVIWDEISDATRAWKAWPLRGKERTFCLEMRDLRRAQQKLSNERKAVKASLRSARARHRAAIFHKYARDEIAQRAKDVERLTREDEAAAQELEAVRARVKEMTEQDTFPPQHAAVGIRMRAARHGYGKGAPPSIAPYRGIVVTPPPGGGRRKQTA